MAKVKYMGTADFRVLDKGEDFGGRLAEPLDKAVVFSATNRWVVDTDEVGLSAEAVEVLSNDPDFKDVSDLKSVPSNLHQRMFLGHGAHDADAIPPTVAQVASGAASGSGGGSTTTGGSTGGRGSRGGSTS